MERAKLIPGPLRGHLNMQERFSDRARHAMALANLEARKLGHDFLAPAHLLLGLISEGQCVATEAMRIFDVDLDGVRQDVQSKLGRGNGSAGVGRRAQTDETKAVIEAAILEARKFGNRYVGTEHLLIALLEQKNSIPAQALSSRGLEAEPLREKALALLRAPVDNMHDLSHSRHGDLEWVHHEELAKAFRSGKFWHTMILAVDAANRLGAGEVAPVHLLMGLLRDSDSEVAKLLKDKGVTADWVRELIVQGENANGNA